ncbi:MAG: tetratricopeptide repeat protein [Candidatus Hydrogenedentota bacterium]
MLKNILKGFLSEIAVFYLLSSIFFVSSGLYATNYSLAKRYLELWEPELALSEVGEDESITARRIIAQAYHYLGRYDDAIKMYEGFQRNRKDEEEYQYLKDIREYHKQFKKYESLNFIVHAIPEDEKTAHFILNGLEKAYNLYSKIFDFRLNNKLAVEVYSEIQSFNRASSLSKRQIEISGAIGICRFNRLMFLSPGATMLGYRYVNTGVHEFFHYIIYKKTKANCPIWIHEGSARFFEGFFKKKSVSNFLTEEQINLLLDACETDQWVSFDDMEPSLVDLPKPSDVSLAFAIASITVDFLTESGKNLEIMKKIYEGLGAGKNWRDIIYEQKGIKSDELFNKIKEHIMSKNYKRVPGATLKLKHILDKREQSFNPENDLKIIEQPKIREYLQIGDGFRMRGRNRAALIEYKKALKLDALSEVILTRIGITYRLLGEIDKAIENLNRATETNDAYPTPYKYLGIIYKEKGDIKRAKEYIEEALEIQPYDPELYKILDSCNQ